MSVQLEYLTLPYLQCPLTYIYVLKTVFLFLKRIPTQLYFNIGIYNTLNDSKSTKLFYRY